MRKGAKLLGAFITVAIIAIGCEPVTQPDIEKNNEIQSQLLDINGLSSQFSQLDPFTQTDMDNNWEADRQFPSAGVTSVSVFGRDNVAQIGIDNTQTDANTFRRTEGIKTVGTQNFGTALQVDLYIEPDWQDKAVRAGFWVVGDDGSGNRDELFGIIEFVSLEPSSSGDSAQGDHVGWRVWDSAIGWVNLGTVFTYGEWVTLGIELDTDAEEYVYYINGVQVETAVGGSNFIREAFLNSYNYGLDTFPNFSNDNYTANWHIGVLNPETKNDCKKGGWEEYGFNNQGQCIRFVNTGKDSRN